MRNVVILAVLALAACGENTGWNPNYSAMHNGSDYAGYLQAREVALHGKGPVPRVIPVQLPAQAPTAQDIAGVPAKAAPGVTTRAPAPRPVPATAQVVRTGPYPGSTPVLVRYAHQESHDPGKAVYQRSAGSVDSAARACRSYAGADAAQTAFIAAGGPVIDPRGLDPDGDGFVCGWDPRPFRQPRI